MLFRLVPKSVTLNNHERRNRSNGCLISPNSVAFWADCVKVVEDTWILSAAEMLAKECSFNSITGSTVAPHCCKAHAKINRKMGNSTPRKIVTPKNFI